MLETLHSTGLRRSEIINLSLSDIDRERGVILVREGKGGKDRIVPIGARALAWIDLYLAEVRPLYAIGYSGDALFLSRERRPLRGCSLWKVAHRSIAEAGKTGACHAFRHTAATQMLEGGADIRFIQAMLGHAGLSTTEIYTQVSIQSLKRVHAATHPSEAMHGGIGRWRASLFRTASPHLTSLWLRVRWRNCAPPSPACKLARQSGRGEGDDRTCTALRGVQSGQPLRWISLKSLLDRLDLRDRSRKL